jgi:peptidoglycan/LPS O-acetylase OafA/YrhL
MTILLIRTIIFILAISLFIRQARRAPARSHKRSAFGLAAGAFALFALINGIQTLSINTDPLLFPVLLVACALLLLGVVQLVRAWRGGEMRDQVAQVRQAMEEERKRRSDKANKS